MYYVMKVLNINLNILFLKVIFEIKWLIFLNFLFLGILKNINYII